MGLAKWKVAAAAVAVGGVYRSVLRPWQMTWGATDAELAAALPGDDLVDPPATQVTRAVTIAATPDEVWPWIAQLGADRGGFYSYDWLENVFGLGIHSADMVVSRWQDRRVGDLVAANAKRTGGWYVAELRPAESLVLQVADPVTGRPLSRHGRPGWEFLWTFALRSAPGGGTRLLVRERVAFANATVETLFSPLGLVSFVMTRKMMLNIKARAERAHRGPVLTVSAPESGAGPGADSGTERGAGAGRRGPVRRS